MTKETAGIDRDTIAITVSCEALGLLRAIPRGFHEDGLSVDTGWVALPPNTDVEVTLSCHDGAGRHVHRFHALVAESGLQGTRLTCSEDPNALALLRGIGAVH